MVEQQDHLGVMSNETFFIHLIYKIANLEDAMLVHFLLARKAHVNPMKTSA